MMLQDKGESLKVKLKSATKLKLDKARVESALRNTECILNEELRTIKAETEFIYIQLEDFKKEIAKVQSQITMIGICEVSEKTKFDNHISNLADHKNGFDKIFSKENEAMECQKMENKKKEAERKELEQQRQKIIEEKNQLQLIEAETIEKECDAIEKECAVLKKRNKAIMLKLRRQLIESEDLRRNLMKNTEFSASKG
ncbi:uncharacterized protein [Epargyreus clarus]|uniref:uncharacterized protein n=1 Tax=Epargyreus clarus TaxID=520877 RepID=UPI003C2FD430